MCIDCFSTRSTLKLGSALCQEISQTFLYVNVMFTIFISKKQDSEGKAWLPPTVLHQPLPVAPGRPRRSPQPVAWKRPQSPPHPASPRQVFVWKVDSPVDTFRAKNSSFKGDVHPRRLRKENPDI